MRKIIFAIVFILGSETLHAGEISPVNPHIQYIGRFDMTNALSPKISWPGSQINVRFEGTSIKIRMNSLADTYYWVIIDDVGSKITISSGSKIYTLATGLSDGEHTASIIKITAPWTPQNFEGIIIDDGKSLLTPPDRSTRKIEFYGDSQTQGAQAEVTGLLPDETGNVKDNNYFSYAPITARALDAEYVCIAQSGASLTVQPNKLTIPACFDRTGAGTQYSMWNFTAWTPDVVCINLGVNDNPLPAHYTAMYIDFVKKIRAKYPNV